MGLHFLPTDATATLLQKSALLTRTMPNGIGVFYDSDQAKTLDLYLEDTQDPFALQYRVYSKDLFFKIYTEAVVYKENALPYFDNKNARDERQNRFRLHEAETVTGADLLPLDETRLNTVLTKKDRLVHPDFVVNIGMSKRSDPAKNYIIKFKARETYWKYYLLGNMARKEAYIADLSHQTEFEFTGSEPLQDKKLALTFRSKNPIPLRERLDCRFQLREKGTGNGKVLIKRLPVAEAKQISKETINGKESDISEIYINC